MLQNDYGLLCHTVINSHNCLEPLLRDETKKEEMQWLAQQTSTHIIQSSTVENGFELFIVGPIAGILIARKYIIVSFVVIFVNYHNMNKCCGSLFNL